MHFIITMVATSCLRLPVRAEPIQRKCIIEFDEQSNSSRPYATEYTASDTDQGYETLGASKVQTSVQVYRLFL